MTTRLSRERTRAASRNKVVLPTPGGANNEDALPGFDQIGDDVDRAIDRPAYADRQADDFAAAVADRRDAVQRPLNAGAIVVIKVAQFSDQLLADRFLSPLGQRVDIHRGCSGRSGFFPGRAQFQAVCSYHRICLSHREFSVAEYTSQNVEIVRYAFVHKFGCCPPKSQM